MRSFIAVKIPDDILKKVAEFVQRCTEIQSKGIKYIEPQNLHITLKFLSEIDDKQIRDISSGIDKMLLQEKPAVPEISIEGCGAFPDVFFPRVLWTGILSDDRLKDLFVKIEDICEKYGVPKETRSFKPHLTIGRVKTKSSREITDFLKQNKEVKFGSFVPDGFSLFKSELTKQGAIHSVINNFKFSES
jgi:2'-5' RNA ligase